MSEPFLALFKHQHDHHSEYAMVYSDEIEDKIDQIMLELKRCERRKKYHVQRVNSTSRTTNGMH